MTLPRQAITAFMMLLTTAWMALAPSVTQAQLTPPAQTETASETETATGNLDLLLDVIENDESREALISELRAARAQAGLTPGDEIVDTLADGRPVPDEGLSLGRRIALITQETAQDVAASVEIAWAKLSQAPDVFEGLDGSEIGVVLRALEELALVIVATIAVFLVLRWFGRSLFGRMGALAGDSGMLRTGLIFVASAVIDAFIVIVSWAVGYLIATTLLGAFGQIGIRETLFLNAFLMVEMAKVVVRMVLSPSAGNLRPLPISDGAAKYLTARINLMVGLVGYGQLLIVPIINSNASLAAGRATSSLIAIVVVGIAVWLVLRNRRPVTDWLLRGGQTEAEHAEELRMIEEAEQDEQDVTPVSGAPEEFPMGEAPPPRKKRDTFGFLARHWHWPVLLYLAVMLIVVLIQPGEAAFRSLISSGQVLAVALLGVMASGALTRVMVRGLQLPDSVNARLPLLEKRLNTFVPKALFVLRMAIVLLVIVFALNAISVIDLRGWMASQVGLRMTSTIFSVASVLLVSFIVWVAMTSWVDYRLNPEYGSVATSRERTLLTLLRNAATIALIVITLMFVLSDIGLDIAPLLASAGVLGLAIGFGAQKMVQDIITGIFIQLENAMNVGDVVSVGGTTGVVERLTIRSVSLRDVAGAFHVIPFSSVDMVTNYMREFGYFVCDMGVAYRESIGEVKQAMLDSFDELRADPEQAANILGDLEWFGVNEFGDSAVVVRARIKCVPGTQWGVGRAYNGVLKDVFDTRGIEIPFPHQTIFLGESKEGATQPFHIRMDDSEKPADA
ncbi:mechanosensitive ion channel domain-containing protein [Chachezhania antarctica]|uniref:mechanosensitive ion channel domain-containing protein n=1 Tax=Chachezhania antarctica TaxID=2340860 RepID=UPI000EAD3716|nr:mechanosensitive ion channel domain-containing protein [Chachezhania antarctica]|tara:strand:- start:4698 stop:7070 length:2373 start_codon:yes stop_codon:yes gene_type:complete